MNDTKKCSERIPLIIFFVIFFIILAIVTIGKGKLDFAFSVAIGNENSFFGQFFAKLGDCGAYLGSIFSFTILYQAVNGKDIKTKMLKIFFILCLLIANFMTIKWVSSNFFDKRISYLIIYQIFGSIIFTFMNIFFTDRIDKKLIKKLIIFAVVVLGIIATAQVSVEILKVIWSRLRFRNMIDVSSIDTSGFTPYYVINFTTDGRLHLVKEGSYKVHDAFKSFPSGHTCSAGVSFAFIILPDIFKQFKKHRAWFYIIPTLYVAIVGLSRIVNTAHFLSDVLFGGSIAFLSAVLLRCIACHYLITSPLNTTDD